LECSRALAPEERQRKGPQGRVVIRYIPNSELIPVCCPVGNSSSKLRGSYLIQRPLQSARSELMGNYWTSESPNPGLQTLLLMVEKLARDVTVVMRPETEPDLLLRLEIQFWCDYP
jgi:hypothetical protein